MRYPEWKIREPRGDDCAVCECEADLRFRGRDLCDGCFNELRAAWFARRSTRAVWDFESAVEAMAAQQLLVRDGAVLVMR